MTTHTLAARAEKIRLSLKDIATAADVNANTVSRTFNGVTDPRGLTSRSIADAIEKAELELRDYLVALHGLPATTEKAA